MSQADTTTTAAISTTASPTTGVRGAIARAAQATGVDFNYLLAQARLESSLNPQAHASASSAAGLYQFTKGTWGSMLARHGTDLTSANSPASHAQMLALRYDPNASAMMAAELAGDNTTALTAVLGRAPTSGELYLAHFLGTAGATRFLNALATNPEQSAAALLPKAAAANSAVFFDAGGARSVGAVMALIQTRMDGALQDQNDPDPSQFATTGDLGGIGAPPVTPLDSGPIALQFTEARSTPDAPASETASMSDTLRNTFGLAAESTTAAPAFVRSAYGRMQAFGL